MPASFELHSDELMAVVAAIILSASRDPYGSASIESSVKAANDLIQQVGKRSHG